jgi:acylphosphatase
MNKKIRAHLIIEGRVQGVFFRMETKKTADHAKVSGWVRNKRDGNVEALLEGDEKSVEAVIEWCRKGPPSAYVKKVDICFENYKGEFENFEITF